MDLKPCHTGLVRCQQAPLDVAVKLRQLVTVHCLVIAATRNLAAAAMHGRIVNIAFLKGSKVEVDLLPIMLKRLTLTGSTLRPRSVAEKAEIARALEAKVWPLLAEGKIRPQIYKTFPLAEAAEAHRLMESSAHVGKIVLVP